MVYFRRIPQRPMVHLRNDLARLYDEVFGSEEDVESMGKINPRVNLEESDKDYIVTAELPGMDKDSVKITFQDGNLSISGEKKIEKKEDEGNFHRFERQHGKFCRTFNIDDLIQSDKIKASFENGILTVTLPKAEAKKAKEIKIDVK